jgi:release factor glutamine methyltransferase
MKFFYRGLTLEIDDDIYYPREDSIMLAEQLEKEEGKKILDMGCGSGFLSILAAKKNFVTSVDINAKACRTAKNNAMKNEVNIEVIHSDLFSRVSGRFDIIVFNPPYLPDIEEDELKDISYHGGKTGREVIEKFIEKAKDFLEENGKILLLISSLTGEKEVLKLLENHGFFSKVLARKKVPWEELIVIEAVIKYKEGALVYEEDAVQYDENAVQE